MASCLMDLYPRYGLMGIYRGYISDKMMVKVLASIIIKAGGKDKRKLQV